MKASRVTVVAEMWIDNGETRGWSVIGTFRCGRNPSANHIDAALRLIGSRFPHAERVRPVSL